MSVPRVLVLALLLILCTVPTASADWFVTPYLGAKFGGDSNPFVNLDQGASNTKLTLGVAAGFVGAGLLGVEADLGYSPRFFERSSGNLIVRSQVATVMGNIILTVPSNVTGYSLRPFVSGGGGLMHVGIDYLADVFRVNSNLVAVNLGGGATGGLTARTSVRFDLRYFRSITNDEEDIVGFGPTSLSFWRAAVGLTIR